MDGLTSIRVHVQFSIAQDGLEQHLGLSKPGAQVEIVSLVCKDFIHEALAEQIPRTLDQSRAR